MSLRHVGGGGVKIPPRQARDPGGDRLVGFLQRHTKKHRGGGLIYALRYTVDRHRLRWPQKHDRRSQEMVCKRKVTARSWNWYGEVVCWARRCFQVHSGWTQGVVGYKVSPEKR